MKRDLDVSGLPTHAYGARDPVFWAVVLLIFIESTIFVLLTVSYFYIRGNEDLWPVEGVGTADLLLGTISAILLFLAAPAVYLTRRNAVREDVRGMRLWTLVFTLLIAASLAVRFVEMSRLPFRWDSHAYGSTFWVTLGMHAFHMLVSVIEGVITVAILRRRPVEAKFPVDVHVTGLYTYFVIFSWAPLYAVLYLERTVG